MLQPEEMCSPNALGKCPVCGNKLDYVEYLNTGNDDLTELAISCMNCHMDFWLYAYRTEESREERWKQLIDRWLKLKEQRRKNDTDTTRG